MLILACVYCFIIAPWELSNVFVVLYDQHMTFSLPFRVTGVVVDCCCCPKRCCVPMSCWSHFEQGHGWQMHWQLKVRAVKVISFFVLLLMSDFSCPMGYLGLFAYALYRSERPLRTNVLWKMKGLSATSAWRWWTSSNGRATLRATLIGSSFNYNL